MRCSSCESVLASFVEATLEPARAHAVAVHLRDCATCEALHRRLRIVDALLMTARPPDLREDFTANVMLAVRALPPPQLPSKPFLPLAAFYLVAAWIATVAVFAVLRPGAPVQANAFARVVGGFVHALGQGMHALWPIAPVALSVVIGVLAIDALLFAVVVVFYRRVRPRLTAYLTAEAL